MKTILKFHKDVNYKKENSNENNVDYIDPNEGLESEDDSSTNDCGPLMRIKYAEVSS